MGMSLTIILSTVVPIGLTILVLVTVFGGLQREQKENERLLASGIPAQGRILNLGFGGSTVTVMGHRHVRVTLLVEVHLPDRPPYQTQIQPLISELLLPSVQPGAFVALRVDPQNPAKVVVAGGAPAAPAPYAVAPGMPGAGAPYAPPPFAAPPAMGPPVAFAGPNVSGSMGKAMRFAIVMAVVTTVPIGAILLYTFVDFGGMFGGGDAPKGGWCKAAASCCKVIGQGAAACNNYASGGMPVEGCKMAYEGYKESAERMKKKCQ